MRKLNNIPKKITMVILAAATMMASVPVSIAVNPMAVYAANLPDNTIGITEDSVGEDDTMNVNEGTVTTNNGHIGTVSNSGAVGTNNGLIGTVSLGATVTTNNGNQVANSAVIKGIVENNGTVVDNFGYIRGNTTNGTVNNNRAGGTVETNLHAVNNNYGTVCLNEESNNGRGMVTENYGTVEQNNSGYEFIDQSGGGFIIYGVQTNHTGAQINKNTGLVGENQGTITLNSSFGKVKKNQGSITDNFGDVAVFGGDSAIVNQYAGIITDASGNNNDSIITNFYGGTIDSAHISVTNNYSDQNISATNQYRSVSFAADEHSSVTYNSGFAQRTLKNSDGSNGDTRYYINVTGNNNGTGTITIVAAEGYKVVNNGADSGTINNNNTYGFTYTLTPDGDNYKLDITGYNGNSCTLSNAMFGLVIQAIQNVNPNPNPNPNQSSGSKTESPDVSNSASTDTLSGQSASNATVITAAQIQAQIANAVAAAMTDVSQGLAITVIDIDLGNEPCLGADAVKALCEGNVAKRCHFTHNGMKFVLFVPVIDTSSAAYANCMALLAAEENGTAGPIRLSLIFAPVGFDLKEE